MEQNDFFEAMFKPKTESENEIKEIPLSLLDAFPNHPFKVSDDAQMGELVTSIEQHGLLTPIIVRPSETSGRYEIISGHRRVEAYRKLEKAIIAAIIRQMDDYEATMLMGDANFKTRTNILPSEKARAYKLMLKAIKRQLGRPLDNVGQSVPHYAGKRSTEIAGEYFSESYKQVQRYIRLTYLIPVLLDAVDNKKLGFIPAEHVSHLPPELQEHLWAAMQRNSTSPTKAQAYKLHQYFKDGILTPDIVDEVMYGKLPSEPKMDFTKSMFSLYFPSEWTNQQIMESVFRCCDICAPQVLEEQTKKYLESGKLP